MVYFEVGTDPDQAMINVNNRVRRHHHAARRTCAVTV